AVWRDEAPAYLPREVDAIGFPDDFGPACARHLLPVAGAEPLVDAELAPLPFRSASDGRHVLEALVRRNDEGEVEAIAAALAGNDRAFAAVERELRQVTTDYDVMALCLRELAAAAGGPVAYEATIGPGERSSMPEAQPGRAVAEEGSLLFVDLYLRRTTTSAIRRTRSRWHPAPVGGGCAREARGRARGGRAHVAAGRAGRRDRRGVPRDHGGRRRRDLDAPHGHGLGLRAPEPPLV